MTEPQPPQTGGKPVSGLYIAMAMLVVGALVIAVLVLTSGILAS